MTTQQAGERAKALQAVTKKIHFGSDAYVANGRIFATVWHDQNKVNLRLSQQDQRRFLSIDGEAFMAIDNAWGKQGWTCVQVKFVEQAQFIEALKCAWTYSAQKTPGSSLKISRSEQKKAKRQALAPLKKLERKKQTQVRKQLAKSGAPIEKTSPADKSAEAQPNILSQLSKKSKFIKKASERR